MAYTEQFGSIGFHKVIWHCWQLILENSKMDADGSAGRYLS